MRKVRITPLNYRVSMNNTPKLESRHRSPRTFKTEQETPPSTVASGLEFEYYTWKSSQ